MKRFKVKIGDRNFVVKAKDSTEAVQKLRKSLKDAKTEYTVRWNDTYHGTKERTSIKANSVGDAIKQLADIVALGGVGTANAYLVSISPNDGNIALYGKVSDLVKKFGDSSTKDSAINDAGWYGTSRAYIDSPSEITLARIVKDAKEAVGKYDKLKSLSRGKFDKTGCTIEFLAEVWDGKKLRNMTLPLGYTLSYKAMTSAIDQNEKYGADKLYAELVAKLKSFEGKTIYEDKTLIVDEMSEEVEETLEEAGINDAMPSYGTKLKIEKDLENDGFERGVDFDWQHGDTLKFNSTEARKRAEGIIDTKNIRGSSVNLIYIQDSAENLRDANPPDNMTAAKKIINQALSIKSYCEILINKGGVDECAVLVARNIERNIGEIEDLIDILKRK